MPYLARFLLFCAALLAIPAGAAAQVDLTIERVWTQNGEGVDQSTFRPGDSIRFVGSIQNPTSYLASVAITFTARGPLSNCCTEIFSYTEEYVEIPPGQTGYYSPSTIPGNAENGEYEFTFVVDQFGPVISRSSRFTVTGGVEPPDPPPPPPEPEPTPPPPPPEPEPEPDDAAVRVDRVFTHLAGSSPWDREQSSFDPDDTDLIEFLLVLEHLSTHNLRIGASIEVRRRPSNRVLYSQRFPPLTCMQDAGHWCDPGEFTYYFNVGDMDTSREGLYEISWRVTIDGYPDLSGTYTFTIAGESPPPPPPDDRPDDSACVVGEGGTCNSCRVRPGQTCTWGRPRGRANNLIVLVHGCCTNSDGVQEWRALGGKIAQRIIRDAPPNSEWEIVVWDWHSGRDETGAVVEFTPPPPTILDWFYFPTYANIAYTYATLRGNALANAINLRSSSYAYIHLIAHSAGSKLIDVAAKRLAFVANREDLEEKPFIHLTFLDAYTRNDQDSGVEGGRGYGYLEDYPRRYAEHYVDIGPLPSTDAFFAQAFNFDITNWNNADKGGPHTLGHQWPRRWYEDSVTSRGAEKFRYGFSLSLGAGNTQFHELPVSFPPGEDCRLRGWLSQADPPGPETLCLWQDDR